MSERRQHKRLEAVLPLKAEYKLGWKQVEEKASLLDIGTGGAKFSADTKVRRGSQVEIELNISGEMANKLLGIEGLDPDATISFKSTGVVVRREKVADGKESNYLAVRFTSPLQLSKTDGEND